MRMKGLWLLCVLSLWSWVLGEISSGRIKGEDEPHLVSWRVLEGITEPFETSQQHSIPAWKHMKNAADQKAASLAIQQALHEYGQLLRHPYMFGEMPAEERYDVFLSMAKLLKTMGFHQRAELLLYEAMSHTTNSFEAHMQLGLLFLEKEDLEQAKMQFKNCLFFHETDISILAHLSVILIVEGKTHEVKFFLSRIISGLESRVRKLSFLMSEQEIKAITGPIDHHSLATWVEQLIVKVLYGEFHITPSATIEMLRYFSNLYQWVSSGELTGRFVFDLGQSLYEGGRPKIGRLMMVRGYESANLTSEGVVSSEVIKLRLMFDFPLVPAGVIDIVDTYLNITTFLSETASKYLVVDLENSLDIYWPLPLLGASALPMTSVLRELLWRFHHHDGWIRKSPKPRWLDPLQHIMIHERAGRWRDVPVLRPALSPPSMTTSTSTSTSTSGSSTGSLRSPPSPEGLLGHYEDLKEQFGREQTRADHQNTGASRRFVMPPGTELGPLKISVGILGGHMSSHAVGQAVLLNILSIFEERAAQRVSSCVADKDNWKHYFSFTLLSLPLVSDMITKRIANKVDSVVNLPIDPKAALALLSSLDLDIVLFPDWQPFPDLLAVMLQQMRIAPVQICFFVRGTSCASDSIDYYLLPRDQQAFYTAAVPATASDAKRMVKRQNQTFSRPMRPAWREVFAEQVVLLDWPLITEAGLANTVAMIQSDEHTSQSRKGSSSSSSASPSSSSSASSSSAATSSSVSASLPLDSLAFMSLESEGRIFFDGQPVAVMPFDPSYIHPLMDETLFKLMRALPSLQVVLALPTSFQTHAQDPKHQTSWARRLARRLWTKGGNLYHRIRSLPFPLSDQRMLQLIRQADVVLDTFPIGAPPQVLSLALATGTPVITMRPGTVMNSGKDDLHEVRHMFNSPRAIRFRDHPLRSVVTHADIPWLPATSSAAAFLDKIGLGEKLVANSTAHYFQLAQDLLADREIGYATRVTILDALDASCDASYKPHLSSTCCPGDDLARFLYRVGLPWATSRLNVHTPSPVAGGKRGSSPLSKDDLEESYLEFLKIEGLGTIVH